MPKKPNPLPFRLTEAQYRRHENEMEGRCRYCGHTQGPIEADAERDPCEGCGQDQVYGIESLLERGEIEIIPARGRS